MMKAPRHGARRTRIPRLLTAALLGLAVAASACSGGTSPGRAHGAAPSDGRRSGAAPQVGDPCGTDPSRAQHYRHVIWIWMENKDYGSVIGSPDAPYENRLAKACGLATNYEGVAHPSLPNYLAATGGSTFGVTDDAGPDAHPIEARSLFGELARGGRQWRGYVESMPGRCALDSSGEYAVKHNPAVYYRRIRGQCAKWDVPMGGLRSGAFASVLRKDALPALSFVVPNLCHDTHDCPVARGDAWLARWIPRIVASPAYRHGDTVIFLTWDEGEGGQHIPLIVVSPTTPRGTRVDRRLNHDALLATAADLLGVRPPGKAATALSMRSAFHLGTARAHPGGGPR
ncbi:MAG: alkaline phosphatase family protein [Streptosporangiaceae bacterium]